MAATQVSLLEEKSAAALPRIEAQAALQSPYATFGFAYDSRSGEGTTKLLAAIHKAKELGASREYIVDLVYAINAFWDSPMPMHRLKSTVLTAI
jgi:hypothetical protein